MADLRALRRKIERLSRGPRRPREEGSVRDPAPPPVVYRRDLPRRAKGERGRGSASGPPVRLEDAIDGKEVEAEIGGVALLVRARAEVSVAPAAGDLFFDLETTGFSSSPLFLVGVARRKGDGVEVRQYLARDYSEEAAAISLFLAEAGSAERLVSFNGKSYDAPFLRARAAATGVPCAFDLPHLDLLHACRRAYKDELPNCRLTTLETFILGKPRHADIPSAEVPEAYHRFVRTGDAREIARILRHNHDDLVSLAELLIRLPAETGSIVAGSSAPPLSRPRRSASLKESIPSRYVTPPG